MDALKKIKYHNPDVVTMDIDMPHLNGLETLERLMGENPMPVIMISSHTKAGSKVTMKALENGANDSNTVYQVIKLFEAGQRETSLCPY